LDIGDFFNFLILYTVGRTPWTGDQPVARPLPTNRTAKTQNKRTQTSMPQVGFEPTIPVFERAKRVHALDRAATVTGTLHIYIYIHNMILLIARDWTKCSETEDTPLVCDIHALRNSRSCDMLTLNSSLLW
jgi:hypothetical protein